MSMQVYTPKTGDLAKQSPREQFMELAQKQLIPPKRDGSDPDPMELEWFVGWCNARGLNPVSGDVWTMRERPTDDAPEGRLITQATIQGLRVIAQQSRFGVGGCRIQWSGDGEKWLDVWLSNENPAAARCEMRRGDGAGPFVAVVTWRERAQPKSASWRNQGAHMLGKCAEAAALRMVCPDVCGTIYTPDEMPRAEKSEVVELQRSKAADEFREVWDTTQQTLKEMGLELMPEPGNLARARQLVEEAGRRISDAIGHDDT